MKSLVEILPPSTILATKVEPGTPVTELTHVADQVGAGSAFFALAGSRADGHAFVGQALERGAAAIVVERPEIYDAVPNGVLVGSTRKALAEGASRWHGEPSKAFDLVGVTGTNGKTTTTYLLRAIWDHLGAVSGVIGTVECLLGYEREPSQLTTPDPLALHGLFAKLRDRRARYAAIEVSSIALDQWRVGGAQFKTGIFTNLTQDHLDYHGDMERYFEAKLRFFRDFGLQNAVVNVDDPWGGRIVDGSRVARVLRFSVEGRPAEFRVLRAEYRRDGTRATVATPQGELQLVTPLIGRHNLYNCLGVAAAAWSVGIDLPDAFQALEDAHGAPGRLERVEPGEGRPHVLVDYAHSDDALRNLLQSVRALRTDGSRLITVFGAGGDRDRGKRPRMGEVVSTLSDVTVVTSDNPRTEDPQRIVDDIVAGIRRDSTELHLETDRRKAIHLALELASPRDIVVIAGKGHEDYQIIGTQKLPFDDRQVVRDFYRTR